jgi:hypothetical protein
MMYVNIENALNSIYQVVIFRKLCDAWGPLTSIILFTKLFYGAHLFLYY